MFTKEVSQHFRNNIYLYLIILGAFIFRVIYLHHGFPFIYNIDEPALVRAAIGLKFDPVIEHFDWPHFNFYFNYFFYILFNKARIAAQLVHIDPLIKSIFPYFWDDPFSFYALSRLINAVLGTLTIVPIYLLGKSMFNKKAGLWASLLFALIPFHIYMSHIATQDISLLFWLMWFVYFAYKASIKQTYLNFLISGIFLGIATGVKYNALLFGLILPLFQVLNLFEQDDTSVKKFFILIKQSFLEYVVLFISLIVIFILGTNNLIRSWDVFWSKEPGKGLLWQLTEHSTPLGFTEYYSTLPSKIIEISNDVGITLFVIYLVCLAYLFIKKSKFKYRALTIYFFSLLVIFFTARYGRAVSHYYIPAYGLIVLVVGSFIAEISSKYIQAFVVILISASLLWESLSIVNKLGQEHTITQALSEYYEPDEYRLYINGENLSTAQVINNLDAKRFKEGATYEIGDVVFSQVKLDSVNFEYVDEINNKGRYGPNVYVYKIVGE